MIEKEKTLEKKLVAHIKKRGGLCLKLLPFSYAGLPDRLCLLPGGRVVFCEIKETGKKLSPLQGVVFDKLAALNIEVYLIDSTQKIFDYVG